MCTKGAAITPEDREVYRILCAQSLFQFNQDIEIFKRKRPTLRVVQVPGDGPFRRYRQWYRQFYSPRADVASIQQATDGVVETNAPHEAPWIVAV